MEEEDEELSAEDTDIEELAADWSAIGVACDARKVVAEEAEKKALVADQAAESKMKAAYVAEQAAEVKMKAAIVTEQAAERKMKAADDAMQAAEVKTNAADEAVQAVERKMKAADDAVQAEEAKTNAADEAVQAMEVLRRIEDPMRGAVDDVDEVYRDLLKLGQGNDASIAAHEKMKLQNIADKKMVGTAIESFVALNHGCSMDTEQRLQYVKEESALFLEKRRCQAVAEMYSLMTALQDNNSVMLNAVTANVGHLANLLGDILDDLLTVVEEE